MKALHVRYLLTGLVLFAVIWMALNLVRPQWSTPFTLDMGIAYCLGWWGRSQVPEEPEEAD